MERPASLRPTFEGLGVEALGDFADRPLRQWGPLPRLLLCEPGDSCASPPSKRLLLAPKMYNTRAKVANGHPWVSGLSSPTFKLPNSTHWSYSTNCRDGHVLESLFRVTPAPLPQGSAGASDRLLNPQATTIDREARPGASTLLGAMRQGIGVSRHCLFSRRAVIFSQAPTPTFRTQEEPAREMQKEEGEKETR